MKTARKELQSHHTLEEYHVRQAYWFSGIGEVEITSNNLIYVENGKTHNGVQCRNIDNQEEIRKRCQQIAELFREIENLNKQP